MLPAALLATSLALTPAQSAKIDAVVAQVMETSHIPGLSLGVARKGHVVFLRGYGTRTCSTHDAANGYTVFRIGSITKQFTAALVMQEADRSALPLLTWKIPWKDWRALHPETRVLDRIGPPTAQAPPTQ